MQPGLTIRSYEEVEEHMHRITTFVARARMAKSEHAIRTIQVCTCMYM